MFTCVQTELSVKDVNFRYSKILLFTVYCGWFGHLCHGLLVVNRWQRLHSIQLFTNNKTLTSIFKSSEWPLVLYRYGSSVNYRHPYF